MLFNDTSFLADEVISSTLRSVSSSLLSSLSLLTRKNRSDRDEKECTAFNIAESFLAGRPLPPPSLSSTTTASTGLGSQEGDEQQHQKQEDPNEEEEEEVLRRRTIPLLGSPRYECDDRLLSNFLLEQQRQDHTDDDDDGFKNTEIGGGGGGEEEETRGMHLVCFHVHNKSISFFRGMSYSNHKTVSFLRDRDGDGDDDEDETTPPWEELAIWSKMKKAMLDGLVIDTESTSPRVVPFGPERSKRDDDWKRQFRPQPWAIFSVDGRQRLFQEDSLPCTSTIKLWEEGVVLLVEGGQFVWPGVKVGFKRTVNVPPPSAATATDRVGRDSINLGYATRNVTLETLSLRPLIFSVEDGLFNDEECTYVREKVQSKLQYSQTAIQSKDEGETFGWSRTSSSTVIRDIGDPQIQTLRRRTAQLVRVDATHLEPTSVSRYHIGEYYGPHRDYYEPTMYGNDPATLRHLHNGYRNRMISIFWYLNDMPALDDNNDRHDDKSKSSMNGVTSFPLTSSISLKDTCTTGLQVSPRKGKIVFMYNLFPDGSIDSSTLNADCPVHRGVKYQGNFWAWNKPVLATQYA